MDFFSQNAPAVFGIAGVLVGGLLSFAGQWRLRKRDYDLRVWDKLLDRRIAAHEAVIAIALQMRVMLNMGSTDAAGELQRIPEVLVSRDEYCEWANQAITTVMAASPWLTTEVTRETFYLQDYLTNVSQKTAGLSAEQFRALALLVRMDFLDISQSLERAAYVFFQNDIRRLTLPSKGLPHKYPRAETDRRLGATELLAHWNDAEFSVSPADQDVT